MKKWIQLTNINPAPAAASVGPSTLTLPNNFRYHEIEVYGFSGAIQTMADGFDTMTLMIDDKPNRLRTFQTHDDVLSTLGAAYSVKRDGAPGGNWRLRYLFSQDYRKEYLSAEKFGLDVDRNVSVQLQVACKAAVQAPTIAYRALVEPLGDINPDWMRNSNGLNLSDVLNFNGGRKPRLLKEFSTPINVNAGSIELRESISRSGLTQCMAFQDPAVGNAAANTRISRVTIKGDGDEFYKRTRQEADDELEDKEMVPWPGGFVIHPDYSDRPDDYWNLSRYSDLVVTLDFEAAPTNGSQVKLHHDRWGTAE